MIGAGSRSGLRRSSLSNGPSGRGRSRRNRLAGGCSRGGGRRI